MGLGLALRGAIIGVVIYLLRGARPQRPDLDRFLSGVEPAWRSPPLFAKLRRGESEDQLQGLVGELVDRDV